MPKNTSPTQPDQPKRKRGRPRKIKTDEPTLEPTVKKPRRTKAQIALDNMLALQLAYQRQYVAAGNATAISNNQPSCSNQLGIGYSNIMDALQSQNQDFQSFKKDLSSQLQAVNETLKNKTNHPIIILNQTKAFTEDEKPLGNNKTHTIINHSQETLSKPIKILKKFKPAISKHKLQKEKEDNAEAESKPEPEDIKSSITKVLETGTDIKTEAVVKTENEEDKMQIKTEDFNDDYCEIDDQEPLSSGEQSTSKFHLINAWLAGYQENRCIKYSNTLRKMLKYESLICTFKCMSKSCSYATTSKKNFIKHLNFHEQSGESTEFLYLCPYCLFEGCTKSDIIDHYRDHDYDKFQCGYCFYRSATDEASWEHCKKHHRKNLNMKQKVYECPLEKAPDNNSTRSVLESAREKYVKKLQCPRCPDFFYLVDPFIDHVFDKHDVDLQSSDMKNDTDGFSAFRSDISNNKVGKYECLYCAYGTDFRPELRSHMQEHPSQLMYMCTRKNKDVNAKPDLIASALIEPLNRNQYVIFKPFNLNLLSLKNNENVSKIDD